jgi:hypothetical protein
MFFPTRRRLPGGFAVSLGLLPAKRGDYEPEKTPQMFAL